MKGERSMKLYQCCMICVVSVGMLFTMAGCGEVADTSSNISSVEAVGSIQASSAPEKSESSSSKNEQKASSKKPSASKPAVTSSAPAETLSERETVLRGLDPELYEKSLFDAGNSARIAALMKKAKKGGSYTIAVLGGSISQGAAASSESKRYGNLVAAWWKENFPKASFTFVNAGIGATNPEMACYRIETDLLQYQPDFVVVDFAVNSANDNDPENTVQTLLYRILTMKNQPAVMGIYFTRVERNSYTAATYIKDMDYPTKELEVSMKKYQIPTISYHQYVWEKMSTRAADGRKVITWRDIGGDYVHPNDNGHFLAATMICKHLEYVKEHLSSISTKAPSVPKLNTDKYLVRGYVTNKVSGVSMTGGFVKQDFSSPSKKGWKYTFSNADSKLVIPVPKHSSLKLFMRFEDGANGKITVTGQNGATKTIPHTLAPTPALIELPAMGDSITITTALTTGSFVILGVGVNP